MVVVTVVLVLCGTWELYSEHLDIKVVFFNDTATTEIYTLSLHDALPICWVACNPKLQFSRHSRPPREGFKERWDPVTHEIGRAHV